MMDIVMPETCWAHKKWNKTASDIKLVFYSSTITMMHGPINVSAMYITLGTEFRIPLAPPKRWSVRGGGGHSQCSSVACVFRYPSFINTSSEPTEIHARLNFRNIAGSQSLLLRRVVFYVRAYESTKSWRISLGITGHVNRKSDTSGSPGFYTWAEHRYLG